MTAPSLTVADIAAWMRTFAPPGLAEDWDNTGLLVGDGRWPVSNILTCLTLTEDVAEEAAASGANLVVSHHPLLFKATRRITADTSEGRTLLTLLKHSIAVYSPHTSFDSAAQGINQRLALRLGLHDIRPLRPVDSGHDPALGSGRYGQLPKPTTLGQFLDEVSRQLPAPTVGYVGALDRAVRAVAVACGSAAEFLDDARRAGCDVLLTGEARFHACLEARAGGMGLVVAGHYATERPAVEELADVLQQAFPDLKAAASRTERDPLAWRTR